MIRTDEQLWYGTLHAEVAAIARMHPTRLAVWDAGRSYTYAELQRRATCWGRALLEAAGGKPLGAVGLGLPKGFELLAALLGALQAGGFCVYLDAALPPARRAALVREAEVEWLCAEDITAGGEGYAGHLLQPASVSMAPSIIPNFPVVTGSAPCFTIATSGTTAEPLSVLVSHRSWLHTVQHHGSDLGLKPEDRMSWFAQPGTSAGYSAPFAALLNGASTHCYSVRESGLPGVAKFIEAQRLTVVHFAPSLLRSLTSLLPEGKVLKSVRLLRVGGEQVFQSDAALLDQHFRPDTEMLNGYGSSEGGYLAVHRVHRATALAWEGPLPVGRPPRGHEILLLNENGQPVPVGEIGHIVVRSRWLPTGYLGQSEATSRCFRPVADQPDVALRDYWSGDLGRFTPAGALVHCGRADHKVKISGWRVDLQAVEAALRALPSVQQAAVIINPHGALTAFVAAAVPWPALHAALSQLLPGQMIPSQWLPLPHLPLTATGKTDRRALESMLPATVAVPPRLPLEEMLLNCWQRVLGTGSEIGVYSNFFEHGGTSLRALQLLALIHQRLGLLVPPAQLMERPTVAQLAEVLVLPTSGSPASSKAAQSLLCLRATGSKPPLYILPGGWSGENELFVFSSMLPLLPGSHPVYGLRRHWQAADTIGLTLSELVCDIVSQIRATGPGPCVLLAECLASTLGLAVALALGPQATQLILLDPSRPKRLTTQMLPPAIQAYRSALATAVLAAPECPVHVISCQPSGPMDQANLSEWMDLTKASSLTIVPGDHESYIRGNLHTTAAEISRLIQCQGSA